MSKKFRFALPGITCAACVTPIETTLTNLDGVKRFHVDLIRKTLLVEFTDPDALGQVEKVVTALDETGTEAIPDIPIPAIEPAVSQQAPNPLMKYMRDNEHLLKGLLGIATGAVFLVLSITGVGLPLAVTYILTSISTALTLYLGKDSYLTAFKKLFKSRTLEMNALFAASSLTAVIVSIASIFVPWLPSMLDAGLLIFGFRHIGIAIEDAAKEKVTTGLTFRKLLEKNVFVQGDEHTFRAEPLESVMPGDIIRIFPGQVIPVDGIAVGAGGLVNTSRINGSHIPAATHDLEILAGMSVVQDQAIDIKVSKVAEDSYLCQMANILEEAEMREAPLETRSEKILKYFVPALFVFALVAGVAVSLLLTPVLAIQFVTALLVSACPCTLGSIVPLAVTVGIAKAANNGIIFKSGEALQTAADIDTVIFDLNGTLTQGNYHVKTHYIRPDFNAAEMLSYWSLLEKNSTHAIGITIRNYLADLGYAVPAASGEVISQTAGKKLIIGEKKFIAGNVTRMLEEKIDLSAYNNLLENHREEQIIFFTQENQVAGYIILEDDSLKDDALMVLKELKKSGKDIHICTGAERITALRYAKRLDIPEENVLADCVPVASDPAKNSKSAYMQSLQAQGRKVAMIGDAENDVIPLSDSNLSILVKSPSSTLLLHERANVIINNSALTSILTSFSLARDTVSNIKQNLGISFGYNFTTLLLNTVLMFALTFALTPGVGVALMIVQASLVFLNVYRFKQKAVMENAQMFMPVPKPEVVFNNTELHRKLGVKRENGVTLTTVAYTVGEEKLVQNGYHPAQDTGPERVPSRGLRA